MKTYRYILEITSQDGRVSLPDDDVIKEAIQYVLYVGQKASIMKVDLPKGLDEAADAYSENIIANGEDMFDAIADGFRAGAEWMAEQGETFETEISNIGMLSLPELSIQAGDKVIVQIRKK